MRKEFAAPKEVLEPQSLCLGAGWAPGQTCDQVCIWKPARGLPLSFGYRKCSVVIWFDIFLVNFISQIAIVGLFYLQRWPELFSRRNWKHSRRNAFHRFAEGVSVGWASVPFRAQKHQPSHWRSISVLLMGKNVKCHYKGNLFFK